MKKKDTFWKPKPILRPFGNKKDNFGRDLVRTGVGLAALGIGVQIFRDATNN